MKIFDDESGTGLSMLFSKSEYHRGSESIKSYWIGEANDELLTPDAL